jgi:hypothetical protein
MHAHSTLGLCGARTSLLRALHRLIQLRAHIFELNSVRLRAVGI